MTAGRPKGYEKTGGIQKGGRKYQTAAVKDAIVRVFHEVNKGDDRYLHSLAINEKKLFLDLVKRCVPQEMEIQTETKVTVDLGAAMAEAERRLADNYPKQIDATPSDFTVVETAAKP
ncbi:MAG: hypothetical protein CBB68_04135 [Rhodospirillaceae bacterium TMED8]|nr:hypothetical protein [Magnetovibrio sp.]OUT51528.1 MAG: hypothetical protein CBB68_04135 [Rhodospirillaceae bacterium TMED8]|tara:strand:- start:2069 stop:2419 length:351 start_codon:yes stop_codon:yes gene_type:complete